jgi:hypothetical protein
MPWFDTDRTAKDRAELLVKEMTFDEKIECLARRHSNEFTGGFRAPSRLGMPENIRYNDGP